MIYIIRHEIWEDSQPSFPVVVHEFRGRTEKEALAVFRAHMQSDAFLRQCETKGVFQDRVRCRTRAFISRDT